MKNIYTFFVLALLLSFSSSSHTKSKNSGGLKPGEAYLSEILEAYAKSSGEKLIAGEEIVGVVWLGNLDQKNITQEQLFTILHANGYSSYKSGGLHKILTHSNMRFSAVPVFEPGKKYHDDQYLTKIVELEKACSGQILPVLRPLVPKHSHLAALREPNVFIVTDTHANIIKLEKIAQQIDASYTSKQGCKIDMNKKKGK